MTNLTHLLLQGGTAGAFDISIGSIGAAGRRSLLRSLLMHEESGLTGTLPSELGRLTNLVELSFASNRFEGRLPTALGYLSALTTMDLSNNHLSSRIPQTMANYTAITRMSLQGNLGLCGNLTDNLVNLIPPVNYADTSITTPCPDLCYEGAMVDNVHACPASQSSCVCPAGTKRVVRWNILTGGSTTEEATYDSVYTCETPDEPGEISSCKAVL